MKYLKSLTNLHEIGMAFIKDGLFKTIYNTQEFYPGLISFTSYYFHVLNDDGIPVGVLRIDPESANSVSVHGGVYSEFRGQAIPFASKAFDELHSMAPDTVVWTKVADSNKASMAFVKKLGFKEIFKLEGASEDGGSLIFYRWK